MKELNLHEEIIKKVLLNMKYDSKKTLAENRLHILNEQKPYKKDGNFYVTYNAQTYMYDSKTKSWFLQSGNSLTGINKYTIDGKLDKTANDLINKLNSVLNKSGLINLNNVKWKDTEEGKRVINDLSNLGIKLTYEPISTNHAFAMAAVESTKKITDLISNKMGGTKWNKYSICITNIGANCQAEYAKFKTFDIQMAKTVNSYPENVDGLKSPNFMILQNFYFDYGKIYEELKQTFKYDKNAYRSVFFPDGWWNWFTTYFGTDNLNTIKSNVSKINNYNLPKVTSKIKIEDSTSLLDILSDGHTLLDIASIGALLLPPPLGIIASSALDGVNALWYLQEGHPYLAALTAIGVIPGIKQIKLLTTTSKMDPKVIKFVEDITYASKSGPLTNSKINNIYAKNIKNLSQAEKLKFGKDIKTIAKNVDKNIIDDLYKTINKWDSYSKYDKSLLKNLFKDEKNFKILQNNNGNLELALKELRNSLTKDQKRAMCVQLGLYIASSEILPLIIPEDLIISVYKSGLLGFKEEVEGNRFDWEETLKTFMVANEKTDPKQYKFDLVLLESAWESGWRPYKEENGEYVEVEVPKKFQTKQYKNSLKYVLQPDTKELLKSIPQMSDDTNTEIPDKEIWD